MLWLRATSTITRSLTARRRCIGQRQVSFQPHHLIQNPRTTHGTSQETTTQDPRHAGHQGGLVTAGQNNAAEAQGRTVIVQDGRGEPGVGPIQRRGLQGKEWIVVQGPRNTTKGQRQERHVKGNRDGPLQT